MAAAVLLSMVLVAAAQAVLRNLTNLDVGWANALLGHMDGADQFLQKGTLCLAFLGASLATHDDKHIAIDVLQRVAPPRTRALMRGVVACAAALTAFFLARVFWMAVLNNGQDRPLAYEVLAPSGPVNICDAPAHAIADAQLTRPGLFCVVRWLVGKLGAPVETPGAAAQLVVPVMFLVMSVRLAFKGGGIFLSLARGEVAGEDGGAERRDPEAADRGDGPYRIGEGAGSFPAGTDGADGPDAGDDEPEG